MAFLGALSWIRTSGLLLRRQLLYPLSYQSKDGKVYSESRFDFKRKKTLARFFTKEVLNIAKNSWIWHNLRGF
jgi:hypothetical protein